MFQLRHASVLASLCVLLAIGCNKESPKETSQAAPAAEPKPAATPAATTPAAPPGSSEAKKIFKVRCVVCHGEGGKGDGPGSAALNPKPRNYTDAEWQKSVTDEEISKTIVSGGAAVGKSPNMPPNPDLKSKPEVVSGLVAIVRSFAKQ
jgi:mono/diheme cytochrome c family protein